MARDLKAFGDALGNVMASGKLSSSDSGRESSLQDDGMMAIEGLEPRIRKLEGMIEQLMNKASEGQPVSLLAEAKNETEIRHASRAGEGKGPMRTGGESLSKLSSDPSGREQRRLAAIAVLKRIR